MRLTADIAMLATVPLLAMAIHGGTHHVTPAKPTPTQVTCKAFAWWDKYQTRANLDKVVADSFKLPAKSYLVADIAYLYVDSITHHDVDVDIQYAAGDCGWGGM